ncbi:lipopolysaccharide biosynthesis protein [Salibacter halophilus]|uniref:Oligosaccharide flippase family protein n=1 Tax=Salibacter halophilus TaxID=1803916 RepID=A0A6N6M7W8_9FLAO|nr:polysaccharide biosynthesis C-terminal domain-containing protein [Salibacter halophilus]KAB1063927.1 oligosaccharide flippase family protein [Salibacter halophilus]
MAALKKLAGQTAIYGLSSMLGRFLNYLLVPLHTTQFITADYGVITEIYALSAFFAVLLTWGLETAYFRYINEQNTDSNKVIGNVLGFLSYSTVIFFIIIIFGQNLLADWIGYEQNPEYIVWMGLALGFDALSAIPLAKLRKDEKSVKFAVINFLNIGVNIGLNLFFIGYLIPEAREGTSNWLIDTFYNPAIGVGYVFIANLIASGIKFIALSPTFRLVHFKLDSQQIKTLLIYALPIMVAGFAGIINETLDRRLIRVILEPEIGETAAKSQVGIYGGVYKLSIVITLFIQAFRYAVEPFFFSRAKQQGAAHAYADVMNWFTIIVSGMFLFVLMYLDLFKHFLGREEYWKGLHIVPILLLANIFLGWTYNLSVWYKIKNLTIYGAYLAVVGAIITVVLNYMLIPEMGYEGAAWATFAAYASMCYLSYFFGQKHNPIPYDLKRVLGYLAYAVALYGLSTIPDLEGWIKYTLNTGILLVFLFTVLTIERKRIKQLL